MQLTYDVQPPIDKHQRKALLQEIINSAISNFSIYGNSSELNSKFLDITKKLTCLKLFIRNKGFSKLLNELPDSQLDKDRKKLIALENFLLLMALKVIQKATITPICNMIRSIESIFLPLIFIVIRNFTIKKNLSISA
ncbi:hypothetical protein EXD98_13980 [Acinetobacter pittii]|uniref:Uncharacterized protein n=1 Tax=Acinetobacter pittii TaxID=48296 RepID=A0AAE8G7S1_ACIPI|nr:hypothetical protein [Acinetobacter pittii]MDO7494863.1 hypothetical protein [Acinetobacter baumannii]RZH26949.1 hypothetical protein EXD98_13980 [Acinetobacter pittii]